jgi:hypothetical protein
MLKESEEDVYFARMMKKPKGRVWHVWICSGTHPPFLSNPTTVVLSYEEKLFRNPGP